MMDDMEPFKVTITPEQQAMLQESLVEAWQPLLQMREQLRRAIPALQQAARFDEEMRRTLVVSPAP